MKMQPVRMIQSLVSDFAAINAKENFNNWVCAEKQCRERRHRVVPLDQKNARPCQQKPKKVGTAIP